MGCPTNKMLRGGNSTRVLNCFYPFEQSCFDCYQLSLCTYIPTRMIPEGGELSKTTTDKNDVMLAGYRECATEALNWLLGLGYEPGHPLIRSLAAHLTKKQAYLEKLSLERYLIDESYKNSCNFDENEEVSQEAACSRYKNCVFHIRNDKDIQKTLVDAVFKGCDLQYACDLP